MYLPCVAIRLQKTDDKVINVFTAGFLGAYEKKSSSCAQSQCLVQIYLAY